MDFHPGLQDAQVGVNFGTVPAELMRTPSRRLSFTLQTLHLPVAELFRPEASKEKHKLWNRRFNIQAFLGWHLDSSEFS
jgi:hypothetical protein